MQREALTLIELLIVIAICAVSFPAFSRAKLVVKKATTLVDLSPGNRGALSRRRCSVLHPTVLSTSRTA